MSTDLAEVQAWRVEAARTTARALLVDSGIAGGDRAACDKPVTNTSFSPVVLHMMHTGSHRNWYLGAGVLVAVAVVVVTFVMLDKRKHGKTRTPASPSLSPSSLSAAPVINAPLTLPPDMSTASLAQAMSTRQTQAAINFYFPTFKAAFLADNKVGTLYTKSGTTNPQYSSSGGLMSYMNDCKTAYNGVDVGAWAAHIYQPGWPNA